MDKHTIRDLLSAQADALNKGQPETMPEPGGAEAEAVSLRALMQLAERTRAVLSPVQPSPAFVHQLSQQLIVTASDSRRAVTRRARNTLVLLAQMLGSAVFIASALAIVAYLLRRRAHRAPAQP